MSNHGRDEFNEAREAKQNPFVADPGTDEDYIEETVYDINVMKKPKLMAPDFEAIDMMIGDSLSVRGKNWMEFAFRVLLHVEEYTIPQYGDKGQDQISDWSPEECLLVVKKRIARYGRNSRVGQQGLDFKKMAHEIQLADEKFQEQEVAVLTEKAAKDLEMRLNEGRN